MNPLPAAPMKLTELLTAELIAVPLKAGDKWEAIGALAQQAVVAGRLPGERLEMVRDALVAREECMTTGMEHGIAIPHAAVEGLSDVVGVLGLNPDGIPFETLDGEPARIIVELIIPRDRKLTHIKTLAEISKLLHRAEVREALLACSDGSAAMACLHEHESA